MSRTEITDAWFAIEAAAPHANPEEMRTEGERRWLAERWSELYGRCYVDGKWQVSLQDATMMATAGMAQGVMDEDYEKTIRIADQFAQHSNFGKLEPYECLQRDFWLGEAQLLTGDYEGALRTLSQRLGDQGRFLKIGYRRVVLSLFLLAEGKDPDEPFPAPIHQLALAAMKRYGPLKKKKSSVEKAETWGELAAILDRIEL